MIDLQQIQDRKKAKKLRQQLKDAELRESNLKVIIEGLQETVKTLKKRKPGKRIKK